MCLMPSLNVANVIESGPQTGKLLRLWCIRAPLRLYNCTYLAPIPEEMGIVVGALHVEHDHALGVRAVGLLWHRQSRVDDVHVNERVHPVSVRV